MAVACSLQPDSRRSDPVLATLRSDRCLFPPACHDLAHVKSNISDQNIENSFQDGVIHYVIVVACFLQPVSRRSDQIRNQKQIYNFIRVTLFENSVRFGVISGFGALGDCLVAEIGPSTHYLVPDNWFIHRETIMGCLVPINCGFRPNRFRALPCLGLLGSPETRSWRFFTSAEVEVRVWARSLKV